MTGPVGPQPYLQETRDAPQYIAVGRIVRAHGVQGEVSMTVLTEFPERFEETEQVYLGNEFEATPYRLEGFRWHKKNLLLKLSGITDRTQAEQLRQQFVQVPVDEVVPLPDGEYYLFEIIGFQVITTDGEHLGVMTEVIETGANDVYVVQDNQRQILLPAIADVVKSVDVVKKQMVVELIDGLI